MDRIPIYTKSIIEVRASEERAAAERSLEDMENNEVVCGFVLIVSDT
jgi:hypothetical protein